MQIKSIHNIVLIGFMGSGKTYWGDKWGKELSLKHIDLDDEISKVERLSVAEIFRLKGEAYFREKESQFLVNFLSDTGVLVSTGGGTPCFNDNLDVINLYSFSIYLKCTTDTLFHRLKNERHKRPLIAHLNDNDLKKFIENKVAERENFYKSANYIMEEEKIFSTSIHDLINV